MSVYTTVEQAQLELFLKRYDIGAARALEPIAAGITNSNYRLETTRGKYVMTLYEHHGDDELDYMLGLQRHLAAKSVSCPAPVADRRGGFFSMLNQRPAAIIERAPGRVQVAPTRSHCALVGAELARFHLAGLDFHGYRANPRGIDWMSAMRDLLDPEMTSDDRRLIENTLQDCARFDLRNLPQGAIHADLFHDNLLFDDMKIGGVIDFDYACNDSFVFDIAVLVNDWCIDARGELDPARLTATLQAYRGQRALERLELDTLPLMLRLGALRFWLSRLHDKLFPLDGTLTFIKDPDVFRRLLLYREREAADISRLLHYSL